MVGDKAYSGSHYAMTVFDMLYFTSQGSQKRFPILCKVMGELSDDTSCAQCVETYSFRKRWTISGTGMLNERRSCPSTSTCFFSCYKTGQGAQSGVGYRPSPSLTAGSLAQQFSPHTEKLNFNRLEHNKKWQTTFHTHGASQPHRDNEQ